MKLNLGKLAKPMLPLLKSIGIIFAQSAVEQLEASVTKAAKGEAGK